MALFFYRDSFRSGKMVLKDQNADGEPARLIVNAKQNNGPITAQDEAFVKSECPDFVFTQEEWDARQGA